MVGLSFVGKECYFSMNVEAIAVWVRQMLRFTRIPIISILCYNWAELCHNSSFTSMLITGIILSSSLEWQIPQGDL